MTAPNTTATQGNTTTQQQALYRLRARYQQDRDLFSRQELARLRFVRWLYQAGRLRS
jgi:hypothetical protein